MRNVRATCRWVSADAGFEQAQQAKARPFDALSALKAKGGTGTS